MPSKSSSALEHWGLKPKVGASAPTYLPHRLSLAGRTTRCLLRRDGFHGYHHECRLARKADERNRSRVVARFGQTGGVVTNQATNSVRGQMQQLWRATQAAVGLL